ncbi:aspartyl/asparaginyl beta-hydroxylase isoform X2 [Aethina tumida]|uniref:aspartyl/asparaginyl beta-hydroxylase isoform X2 n=1 Tax=Aethina tumida TaxID=116153 RepID=UPI00096AFAC0|nr:aspartyl/asparaginyl beta-hydroxylase isoform X2 [Aethina tumida]
MSGDVQPRKRKDKKRRKDDSTEQAPAPPKLPPSVDLNNDDVNIHVQKEGGTGGNICSKIIFFLLSSALIVLIGLIITEYRGLTDLDTVDTESRFSQIFEGWVDNSVDDHDELDHVENAIHSHEEDDDHDDEHDEEALSEEQDDDHDDDEHDDEHDEEDQEEDEDEEGDQEVSEEVEETQEDDDEDETPNDDDDDDEGTQEDEDEDEDAVEDNEVSEEKQEDEEDDNVSENAASPEANDDNDEDDDGDQKDDSEEQPTSQEEKEASEEQDVEDTEKEGSEEKDAADNDDEPESKAVIKEKEEGEAKTEDEENETSGSSMVVKLGVGLALLVVAHVVLIRKWKSVPSERPKEEEFKEPTPDLSRRNTIIPPPPLQEIEQDIENDEEEYSDEEGEYSEDEEPIEHKSARAKYEDLRANYNRPFTPESDEADFVPKSAAQYDDEDYEEEEESADDDDEEVEEEEVSEGDDYNDDDDEELLKRLEAKYGRLDRVNPNEEAEESDKQSDDDYENKDITNKEDWPIKEKIDEAHQSIDNNAAYAIKIFDAILEKFPSSPRSLYGKALALDRLADQKKSNEILQKAITLYMDLLNNPNIPDALFQLTAEQSIKRLRFMGQYRKAISVHQALIARFPESSNYLNQLAVTYLTINRVEDARVILQRILAKWPNDGFALVHYGFILKNNDNNLEDGVKYLQRGIDTNDEGVIDGRFFFHLGDALTRLGRKDEALKIYEHGVQHGVFLSKYQRSLYNVKRLTGRPWWTKQQTPYEKLYSDLEKNWREIRREGLAILNQKGYFVDESENLRNTGEWKQFELYARGQKNIVNCKKCPVTCQVIDSNPVARNCKRGQTKFSVMHPGTHVWPHCGPTNCRLRVHLGLKVPPKTFIRVADEIRSWEEGKLFIFDDSFEHEVWHNGTEFRLVLIVDVWHPELTIQEWKSLSPI